MVCVAELTVASGAELGRGAHASWGAVCEGAFSGEQGAGAKAVWSVVPAWCGFGSHAC